MARNVTLTRIVDDARLYADLRGSDADTGYVTKAEVERLVNLAITELYDLLIAARGQEYFETLSTGLSTVAGTATVSLPADFYQLLSLHLRWGSDTYEPLTPLKSLMQTHLFRNAGWSNGSPKAYRLRGGLIEFFPTPSSVTSLELRYIPAFADLTDETDPTPDPTFDGVNGWEKMVALKVAIEVRTIQGLPHSWLMQLFEKERERVEELAAQRDATHPVRFRDVAPEGIGIGEGWEPWRL